MFIHTNTLDDALLEVYPSLLSDEVKLDGNRGIIAGERIGATIKLTLPRARLSRTETRGKIFSALGELLWYLAGDNKLDFISHYISAYSQESDDNVTVTSAYGPRLFNNQSINQIDLVIKPLKANKNTKRAVIQLYDPHDLLHKRPPCTTTLQFLVRSDLVHLITTMRSNDAYIGLPHDIFCFTMLQEIVARTLEYEVGSYTHFVGSLHLYEKNRSKAQQFVQESVQATVQMPEMPHGDPWPQIRIVLNAEATIRGGHSIDAAALQLEPYWADIVRLLQIHANPANGVQLASRMSSGCYKSYINDRVESWRQSHQKPETK